MNKQSVYKPLEGTSTMFISMQTCKYKQVYRHSQYTNKHTYKHQVFYLHLGKVLYRYSMIYIQLSAKFLETKLFPAYYFIYM